MEAGAGIEYQIACLQFHAALPVGVFYCQLAAVIVGGIAQEQGSGQIRAHAFAAARYRPHAAIDMAAIGLSAGIAVEKGRHDFQRQRGGVELRIASERLDYLLAQLKRHRMHLRQLGIVLDPSGKIARGLAPIAPGRAIQQAAEFLHLLWGQDFANLAQLRTLITILKSASQPPALRQNAVGL